PPFAPGMLRLQVLTSRKPRHPPSPQGAKRPPPLLPLPRPPQVPPLQSRPPPPPRALGRVRFRTIRREIKQQRKTLKARRLRREFAGEARRSCGAMTSRPVHSGWVATSRAQVTRFTRKATRSH